MEIQLKVVVAIVVVALVLGVSCLGLGLKKKKHLMILLGALLAGVTVGVGGLAGVLYNSSTSYEVGAYPDEEKHYLVTEVKEDGTVSYIDPSDFTVKEAHVDLKKALISGRIPTIGLNNRYKKYFQVGNVKVWWDSYEDTMILSKYDAIQLGFIEATGAADEEQFKIATSSDAVEQLQESLNSTEK